MQLLHNHLTLLATIAGLATFAQSQSPATIRLPPSVNATYSVGSQAYKLVDESRIDPYNTTEKRAVAISVYYPSVPQVNGACPNGTSFAPYVPAAMAAAVDQVFNFSSGSIEAFQTNTCVGAPAIKTTSSGPQKLILFSPGLGGPRLIYQTLTTSLAAQGYIVVAIDHPYDSLIVEYPDGTLVYGANINETSTTAIERAVEVRTADVKFVLDEVCTTLQLTQGLTVDCGVRKVGMFGHSLGGATAADMTVIDERIGSGANLDGTFVPTQSGPLVSPLTPFLLMTSDGHNATNDATYADWYQTPQEKPATRVTATVLGAQHLDFSDLPVLIELANGTLNGFYAAFPGLFGPIDGFKVNEIVQAFLIAGFGLTLDGDIGNEAFFHNNTLSEVAVVVNVE